MATNIPEKLRNGDILRYSQRAVQLEKVKPAIAYWCYYWVVNQILAKGLHQTDDECMNYTTELVDKLEQFKAQYPNDDFINDDTAGQAAVERFGLETFQRADNAVHANKASKQTAETFQAASTFLELVQIWSPPTGEIAAKIKYAKYHALRIARALKAGEDPNLSNPPPVETSDEMQLDPNDPDVQPINAAAASHADGETKQPFVEDVPDEQDNVQHRLARQSTLDQSLHPSRASSLPRPASDMDIDSTTELARPATEFPLTPQAETDNALDVAPSNPRQDSEGGGYFPELPSAPTDPDDTKSFVPSLQSPNITSPAAPSFPVDPQDLTNEYYIPPPSAPSAPPSVTAPPSYRAPPQQPQPQRQAQAQPQKPVPSYRPTPAPAAAPQSQDYNIDDEAVMLAQKHAKWAISALNFEDVPTAVKELRNALKVLGAQ